MKIDKPNMALLVKAGLVKLPDAPPSIDPETEALYRSNGWEHKDGRWNKSCVKCGKPCAGRQCAYCYSGRSPELDSARTGFLSFLKNMADIAAEIEKREHLTFIGECLEEMCAEGTVIKMEGELYKANRVKFIVSPA